MAMVYCIREKNISIPIPVYRLCRGAMKVQYLPIHPVLLRRFYFILFHSLCDDWVYIPFYFFCRCVILLLFHFSVQVLIYFFSLTFLVFFYSVVSSFFVSIFGVLESGVIKVLWSPKIRMHPFLFAPSLCVCVCVFEWRHNFTILMQQGFVWCMLNVCEYISEE